MLHAFWIYFTLHHLVHQHEEKSLILCAFVDAFCGISTSTRGTKKTEISSCDKLSRNQRLEHYSRNENIVFTLSYRTYPTSGKLLGNVRGMMEF
jgi:hypothetical protein